MAKSNDGGLQKEFIQMVKFTPNKFNWFNVILPQFEMEWEKKLRSTERILWDLDEFNLPNFYILDIKCTYIITRL